MVYNGNLNVAAGILNSIYLLYQGFIPMSTSLFGSPGWTRTTYFIATDKKAINSTAKTEE